MQHLEVSKNPIGDIGISSIADNLHDKNNKTLVQLVVNHCEFHSNGAKSIGNMLKKNKTLKFLNISDNPIGDDGISAVASGIKTNTSTALIELNISGCEFHSEGIKSIAAVLKSNKTLKSLNLSENHVGNNEISTLACGIQDNITLTELHVNGNFDSENADKLGNKTLKNKTVCLSVSVGWITYEDSSEDGDNWRIHAGGN